MSDSGVQQAEGATQRDPALPDVFEGMVEEILALKEQNQQAQKNLATEGARLDPIAVTMTRVEALADVLLTPGGKLLFEVTFERKMAAAFVEAIEQVRAKNLHSIVEPSSPGGLLLPGKG